MPWDTHIIILGGLLQQSKVSSKELHASMICGASLASKKIPYCCCQEWPFLNAEGIRNVLEGKQPPNHFTHTTHSLGSALFYAALDN